MKRLISILMILSLLFGCAQRVISPSSQTEGTAATQVVAATPTDAPSPEPFTPAPTETPRPALPTYGPKGKAAALFPEELLSHDGEPIGSKITFLLTAQDLSKDQFYDCFMDLIHLTDELDADLLRLADKGRTLAEDRRDRTVDILRSYMNDETLDALQAAYAHCSGEGKALSPGDYTAALSRLVKDVERTEVRTVPYFGLDGANDYRTVLERYMGEPVSQQDAYNALEALMQTEAYALAAALTVDPEAARKKEPISLGSYDQNMAFLIKVTQELCPLPDKGDLPIPPRTETTGKMDLLELAFRLYPGMAYLEVYVDQGPETHQARWANAPDGYLAGLAIHGSHAVIPYLKDFSLDYVQYRWYEDMLYATMTGMCALLIHYYGYSASDLAEYLKGWGAESFTGILYEKAMNDPFEALASSYGYYRYLDICQAAMDAGCDSEAQFLRDYLAAGPAPFDALKEYMISLYQNEG